MSGIDSQGLWQTSLFGRLVQLLFVAWDGSVLGRILSGLGRFGARVFSGSIFGRVLFSEWPDRADVRESQVGRLLAWVQRVTAAVGGKLQPFVSGLWTTSLLVRLVLWVGRVFQPVVATSFFGQAYAGYAGDVQLMPGESRKRATSPLLLLLGSVIGLISLLPQGGSRLLSPTTLMIVGIWGIAVLWVGGKIIAGDFEWRSSSSGWPLALLLVVAALSTVQSVARMDSLMNFIIWTTAVLLFWMVVNLARNTRDAAAFLGPILAASVVMTAWAAYQYVKPPVVTEHWSDPTEFGNLVRVFAGFGNPNYLGEYMALFMPPVLALMIQTPKRRFELALLFILMSAGLLLTFTRGSWLAVLLALVIFVFMRNRHWSILLVLGGIAGALMAPPSIIKRFISAFTFHDSSSEYRKNVWAGVFAMLKKFWFVGAGLGAPAFTNVYRDFMLGGAAVFHAHNVFLEMFAEMGILGFIAVLWALVAAIRLPFAAGLKERSSFMTAAIPAALIGLLVQGMVEHIWYNPKLLFAFWALAGLGVGLALGEREGSQA